MKVVYTSRITLINLSLKLVVITRLTQRVWYYTEVFTDTQNEDVVYDLSASALRSKDGGRSWEITSGNIIFVVTSGVPDALLYNCEFHGAMTGSIQISN